MKAMVLNGVIEPFSLENIEKPVIEAGYARVKVEAAALNHRDLWIQKGQYAGLKFPVVLGSDGSGTVEAVGSETDAGWIGEKVILNPSLDWGENPAVQGKAYHILGMPTNGTLAEFVKIPVSNLAKMPAHLSFEEAAALPLAGLTAWRALVSRAGLRAGERCLITGTGGGVAQFALQFAVGLGAEVWVTSGSNEKIEKAMELGAKGGANYRDENWSKDLKTKAGSFDVIIDSAGGEAFGQLVNLAAAGGRIAFYGGTLGKFPPLSPQKLFWKQISILGSTMGNDQDFQAMLNFVAEKKLVPAVDEVFPLQNLEQAVGKMADGKQFGKIVLKIN